MFKALRPSSWGLKIIDILLILVVVSFVVAFAAPTSGLGVWLHQGWTLAGLGRRVGSGDRAAHVRRGRSDLHDHGDRHRQHGDCDDWQHLSLDHVLIGRRTRSVRCRNFVRGPSSSVLRPSSVPRVLGARVTLDHVLKDQGRTMDEERRTKDSQVARRFSDARAFA